MMLSWKKFKFACAIFSAIFILYPATSFSKSLKEVRVRTISTKGNAVTTTIEMSIENAEWKAVEGASLDGGGIKLFVDQCDGNVKFKAYKRDTFGFYTRSKPNNIKFCQTPEVVFDDYVPTSVLSIVSPTQLSDPTIWAVALGAGGGTSSKGPVYASAFETALAKGDFGYIAVASSELAANFRAAGQAEAAYPFETLSVKSTMEGIFKAEGIDSDQFPVLETSADSDALVMSEKAKKILEKYQIENLGLSPTSRDLGKTGWVTMRSLAGGESVNPLQWKLAQKELSSFDASVFSGSLEK